MTAVLRCPFCDEALHPVVGHLNDTPVLACPDVPVGTMYSRGGAWTVHPDDAVSIGALDEGLF